MAKFPFSNDDFENVELVRQIVIHRLRTESTYRHLDSGVGTYDHLVDFSHDRLKSRFLVLARQVLWEFLCQGILAPGSDSSNLNLPFFRVTPYGDRVLAATGPVPYDPSGYLGEVRNRARASVGPVAIAYVEHALDAFNKRSFVAAVLLLGVSAEAAFLDLLDVIRCHLKDPNDAKKIAGRSDQISPQHAWVVARFDSIPAALRRTLPESVGMSLRSLLTLIRLQRNELGHPQLAAPAVSREQAFLHLSLYPLLVSDIEAFADFCRANGL